MAKVWNQECLPYFSVFGANTSSKSGKYILGELLNYRVAPDNGMDYICNHRCKAIYHASPYFLFGTDFKPKRITVNSRILVPLSVLDKSSALPPPPQQADQVCIPPSGCVGLVCEVDRSLQSSVEINVWRAIPPLPHTHLPCAEGKYWWPSVGRVLVGLMRNSVIGFDCDAQERCYGQSVNGGTISGWWRRMWRHTNITWNGMLLGGETDKGHIQDLQAGLVRSLIESQLELSQRKRWSPSMTSKFYAILLYITLMQHVSA